METLHEDKVNRIRKALIISYNEREKAEVEGHWREAVIKQVYNLGSHYIRNGYLELLEGFVWRYAPVACALILILTTVLFRLDLISDYDLVQLFMEDPLDYSLMDYIG
jgi:hypothetical protein